MTEPLRKITAIDTNLTLGIPGVGEGDTKTSDYVLADLAEVTPEWSSNDTVRSGILVPSVYSMPGSFNQVTTMVVIRRGHKPAVFVQAQQGEALNADDLAVDFLEWVARLDDIEGNMMTGLLEDLATMVEAAANPPVDVPLVEIDYRVLLKKYIAHVVDCEGVAFLSEHRRPHKGFSDVEWSELNALAADEESTEKPA